ANLGRREPVDVYMPYQGATVPNGEVGDVLRAPPAVTRTGRRDTHRILLDDVVHYGDVVGREIPQDIDVRLDQPEVDTDGVEIIQITDVASGAELTDSLDRAGEAGCMIASYQDERTMGE